MTPKPVAVAVAIDLGKPHGDKIVAEAALTSPTTGSAPPPKPAASTPPNPKRRPREVARADYRVQLHALASDGAVRREWRRLRQRHGALFSGLKLTISRSRPASGAKTVYRMQIGALSSRTEARVLCRKLRRRKLNCMVVQ